MTYAKLAKWVLRYLWRSRKWIAKKLYPDSRKADELLTRVYAADRKPHWQEGDTLEDVLSDINDYLSDKYGSPYVEYRLFEKDDARE